MNTLWIPEFDTPPKTEERAVHIIKQRISDEGIQRVIGSAVILMEDEHEPLGLYVDKLGMDLNDRSEGIWPAITLRAGAALALLGYKESGINAKIDTNAVEIGEFIADLHGVPDTFVSSAFEDKSLRAITLAALHTPLYDESKPAPQDTGGYAQVLDIGAGCARHFLKQTVCDL